MHSNQYTSAKKSEFRLRSAIGRPARGPCPTRTARDHGVERHCAFVPEPVRGPGPNSSNERQVREVVGRSCFDTARQRVRPAGQFGTLSLAGLDLPEVAAGVLAGMRGNRPAGGERPAGVQGEIPTHRSCVAAISPKPTLASSAR